jgi:hypothetical protein
MHLRILPDHQKLFFKKDIFYCLEWLKTCFDAFAHFYRPPVTFCQKRYFNFWNGWKCVLMHLRKFPDHQNHFFKKYFFDRQECLKTCFDAFAHTSRPPEIFFQKRYIWTSGVGKHVFWCICTCFQTTSNFFSKKIFLNVWTG